MAIYRGIGGAGDSTTDATVTAVTQKATEAASSASSAATSASNASTSASNASTSATNASNSASNASTSETNASNSASAASTSASNASTSETNAQTAQTAAELAETNAETAETNAASSASAASTSASNASTSASTATTQASNAATSASNASTSATNASNSASAASTSETNASNSASAASTSATNAQTAADTALSALDNFDDRYLGQKTSDPTLDNDGNALVAGALYFNTTDDVMKVYDGSVWVAAYASLSGTLVAVNNLSDVASVSSSRTNLGLGTAATTASTDYATAAQGSLADSALQNLVEDTTPQLGGDLDLNSSNITGTGNIDVTGTVTADGLTVDTNTLHVDATNNRVGISTSSPSQKLDVNGNTRFRFASGTGAGTWLDTVGNANRFFVGTDAVTERWRIFDAVASAQRIVLDSSGNVGIGTATPSDKLDVNGSVRLSASTTESRGIEIGAGRTGDGFTNIDLIGDATYTDYGLRLFRSSGANLGGGISSRGTGDLSITTVDAGDIKFDTTNTERMRITSSGNVGIGTTNPSTALTVITSAVGSTAGDEKDFALFECGASDIRLRDIRHTDGTTWPTTETRLHYSVDDNPSKQMWLSFYNPDSDIVNNVIRFGEGDSNEWVRIDNGNVGIGTTSPATKLDVDGGIQLRSSNQISFFDTGYFIRASAGLEVQSADYIRFLTNGATERLRITSAGNVGIGTSSPSQKLDVNGITRFRFASGTGAGTWLDTVGNANRFFVGTDAVTESWRIFDAVASAQRIVLDSSGNVGIGTSSPTQKLDVAGVVKCDYIVFGSTSSLLYESAADSVALRIGTDGPYLEFKDTGGLVAQIGNASGELALSSSGTERMRITSTGNVGIGTSSPSTALEVNGTVTATTVDLGDWTITESAGVLKFAHSGTDKMKLDSSGNLTVVGDVTAFGTI